MLSEVRTRAERALAIDQNEPAYDSRGYSARHCTIRFDCGQVHIGLQRVDQKDFRKVAPFMIVEVKLCGAKASVKSAWLRCESVKSAPPRIAPFKLVCRRFA